MALTKPIFVGSTTTNENYDILRDIRVIDRIKKIYPKFPTETIPIDVSVLLPDSTPCQIKVNDGEWDDFLLGMSYDTGGTTYIKSLVLSANNCPFHVSIKFE